MWTWAREMLGLLCLGVWWFSLGELKETSDQADPSTLHSGVNVIFGSGLIAFFFLGLAAVCRAKTLATLVAAPFIKFIDAIYLGGSSSEIPPLSYDVLDRRLQEGRWAEAAEECDRITRLHPYETRAYADGLAAALRAGENELVKRLRRRAQVYCPEVLTEFPESQSVVDAP